MSIQISTDESYAYAEVLEILSFTHTSLVQKIPQNLLTIFQENASSVYEHHLNKNIPIENQDISPETASLLALISLNYWCETDQEKDELKTILAENENLEKKELMEKYNPNNIFKNSSFSEQAYSKEFIADNETKNNLPVDVSLSPWYSNIIRKIREFFSKFAKKNN